MSLFSQFNTLEIIISIGFLDEFWVSMLLVLFGTIAATIVGAVVQNKLKGDDIVECGRLGIFSGLATGIVGVIFFVLNEIIKGTL